MANGGLLIIGYRVRVMTMLKERQAAVFPNLP
jgi:hypothetical protein